MCYSKNYLGVVVVYVVLVILEIVCCIQYGLFIVIVYRDILKVLKMIDYYKVVEGIDFIGV